MSELSKRIGRTQRREATGGMGFHPAQRQAPRTLLLGVRVPDIAAAKTAIEAGADLVLLQDPDAKVLGSATTELGARNCGVEVQSLGEDTAEALHKAGIDFVVSPLSATASAAVDTEQIGHVVVVATDIPDSTLRSLGPLGLDALLVDGSASAPTLADQLELVRLSSFSSLPLAVTVEPGASVAQLRVLRDSGAVLAVAPAGTSADELKNLSEMIAAIPAPRKASRGGDMALLPSTAGHAHDEDDEMDDPE